MEALDAGLQIEELRERLRARLALVNEQLQPLQVEAAKLRTQLDLLAKLLRVTNEDAADPEFSEEIATPQNVSPSKAVADNVAEILSNADEPLHISQIRTRYLENGRVIPGKGTEANLLVYIVRDQRFVRVAKGTYALAPASAMVAQPPVKRRKKRRRK